MQTINMAANVAYYIGVDVGTSSVRAALVSREGRINSISNHSIDILEPDLDFYEQSSDNIWSACCLAIKDVTANIDKSLVRGIGFDATCSLVVLDEQQKPLSISPSGDDHWNVVMWMDHRAEKQAQRINQSNHPVLKYVGGTISLEMQTPKLLWLKENMKTECWDRAGHFMDLPDFLTWKATGSLVRSQCSLVCKWTYQAGSDQQAAGWDDSYFTQIGLEDLMSNGYKKIGSEVQSPGSPCGQGLSESAAQDTGLIVGTPVATSIIDAHAGGLGCLGCCCDDFDSELTLTSRLALICGTSSCHMAISSSPLKVTGVWGPYLSAMLPGYWLNEGGQSASGKLLDHVVETHSAYDWVKEDAAKRQVHVYNVLEEVLEFKAKQDKLSHMDLLTKGLHVWPDYHGNRSPLADPSLRGMISGLTLSSGVEDLAIRYLATVQALAYGTQHILAALTEAGHSLQILHACGGLAKNRVFIQAHANATGLPVLLPETSESVLLGSAILGAYVSGDFSSIQDAMTKMSGRGELVKPQTGVQGYHQKKQAVFHKMVCDQVSYQQLMEADS